MSHTPGPWKYTDTVVWVPVAVGYQDDYEWHQEKIAGCGSEDDARLIAAAPELLEALEEITKWFSNVRGYTYDGVLIDMNENAHKRLLETVREAIRKARGQ